MVSLLVLAKCMPDSSQDLFSELNQTVGQFLSQPGPNRVAKSLTWVRSMRMNHAQSGQRQAPNRLQIKPIQKSFKMRLSRYFPSGKVRIFQSPCQPQSPTSFIIALHDVIVDVCHAVCFNLLCAPDMNNPMRPD